MPYSITREIGIDMAHRVPTHGSKCWNLHGHRYKILATAQSSTLHEGGVQQDMVLDFSFLHSVMMAQIHDFCDHGLTIWKDDPWLPSFFLHPPNNEYFGNTYKELLEADGYYYVPSDRNHQQTQLLIVNFIPTAEKLAEFWFKRMTPGVNLLSNKKAHLSRIEVFETPNCSAVYPAVLSSLPLSTHEGA